MTGCFLYGTYGELADVANALWYAAEGNAGEAVASGLSALPGLGSLAGKLVIKAGKSTRAARYIENIAGLVGNAPTFLQAGSHALEGAAGMIDRYLIQGEEIDSEFGVELLTLGLNTFTAAASGRNVISGGNALRKMLKEDRVAGKISGTVKRLAADNGGYVDFSVKLGGKKTNQIIKNRYPNEVQIGKSFNYVIENGKIHIENGIQNVDFVIDMDGNLHLGQGHSFLANGMDVQAAGTLKVNSQGYVRAISNGSGHYTPTVEQGRMFPSLLNELGIRTKNAWLELGDYRFTSSGYVDLTKSSTIVEQLK